jgi:hypothetical protein
MEEEKSESEKKSERKREPRYKERIKKNGYNFELRVYGSAQELRWSAYEYIIMRKRQIGK